MAIGLFVAHRMTGHAGDRHRWRSMSIALSLINGILDFLPDTGDVADITVALMDGEDLAHRARHMAGGTTGRGRDHVMGNIVRWGRVVEGVLSPVTVSAVLRLAGDAVSNSGLNLLARTAMTLGAGVLGPTEGHNVDHAGSTGIRAVMTVGTEWVSIKVIHVARPG